MLRDKKIVLLSHCFLNVNAKVYGLANYKGALEDLIRFLLAEGFGLIQLPCPEMSFAGNRRWGQVKEQLDTPFYRKHCEAIFIPFLEQIIDYNNNGYRLAALIGVNGSPTCGIQFTCSSSSWGGEISSRQRAEQIMRDMTMTDAPGVFMERIIEMLQVNGLNIPLLAVDEANPASSVAYIKEYLRGED